MSLFSSDGKKKVKKVKKNQNQKKSKQKASSTVETVVEVKTVGDIPPMLEARKLLGEDQVEKAAAVTYKAAKADYCRYFSRNASAPGGEREFMIREIQSLKGKINTGALVDGHSMFEAMDEIATESDRDKERLNALKRLVFYYMNYYEPSRFARSLSFSGDEMLDKFEGIYNYMDIMKLYFQESMME